MGGGTSQMQKKRRSIGALPKMLNFIFAEILR
jgi:hypothetical protein